MKRSYTHGCSQIVDQNTDCHAHRSQHTSGCTTCDVCAHLQAILEAPAYFKRLGILFMGSFSLLGGPIAYQTFDPFRQVRAPAPACMRTGSGCACMLGARSLCCVRLQSAEFLLSGTVGAAFVVALAVLRIYLGWSYVGDRLLSAAVAYEETGWYDGQVRTGHRSPIV